MAKDKEEKPANEGSFFDSDPSFAQAVQTELDKKEQLEQSRAAILEALKDPVESKREEDQAALQVKIDEAKEAKRQACELASAAQLEVERCNKVIDRLITDMEILKARNRNHAAENVMYVNSQVALRAKQAAEAMAKRDLALQMGLITPQQAAGAGLSPIDIATAARNKAARRGQAVKG